MRKKKIVLDINSVKEFVSGRIRFEELTNGIEDPDSVNFACSEPFYLSLDDIKSAIDHFIDKECDCDIVIDDWYDNLYWQLGDAIHIPALVGEPDDTIEELDIYLGSSYPFYDSDAALVKGVFTAIEEIDEYRWDCNEDPAYCVNELIKLQQRIDNYSINKGKPHDQWILTEGQKLDFLYFYNEDSLAEAEPVDQEIYKKILIEYADKDNLYALRTLGYACYGNDNPVFSCDWNKSLECFLKLMNLAKGKDQAMYANTLGYIYYYGRCNNGVPQYDEAYKYFSLAAFYGYYEARYKVADMIRDGKGIFQNEEAAFRMYTELYDDNYDRFLRDGDCVLSDVALRIASCYQHGKGTYKNLMTAYYYYLIAKLAIDERMKKSNFFGLTTVSASIRTGLSEVKKELGTAIKNKYISLNPVVFFERFLLTGSVRNIELKIKSNKQGNSITFTRLKANAYDPAPNMLFVFPEISYCKKSASITCFVPKECSIKNYTDSKTLIIDKVKEKKDELFFYYKRKLVLSIEKFDLRIKAEKETGSKVMHKFASVQFEPGGKTYDYLCDGLNVNPGDFVLVPGMTGPQKTMVFRVFEQSEADAPLDIVKYKKVIEVI